MKLRVCPSEVLESVRRLTNVLSGGIRQMTAVLAGGPGLDETLAEPSLRVVQLSGSPRGATCIR